MLRQRMLILLTCLLAFALIGAGCGKTTTDTGSQPAKEPYKIGVVLDISGKSSSLGVPERNTVEMLVDQINKKGGINGHPLDATILDTKSNETEAALAMKKLIQQNVLAVVGSSTSGSTMAMVESAQNAGMPLVSCAASIRIVEPVAERNWVFKTAQSDVLVATKIVEYLKSKGMNKVAFISVNNAYGDSGRGEFEKAAAREGVTIVAQEKFEQDDSMMTSQLTSIKKQNPQAVIAWAIPPAASSFTVNYRQMGLAAPLIHSHGIGNQTFIELAGDSANGVIFPIGKLPVVDSLPDSDTQKSILSEYTTQYTAAYGPPNPFGGYGWDAFQLVVKAIEKAGPDKAKIRDELEKTQNFVGVTGIFNMSPTDHNGLSLNDLVMVEIKDQKWQIIK